MNEKKSSLVLLVLATMMFASCGQKIPTKEAHATTEEHDVHDDFDIIKLNSGKKWKVVGKMLSYVRLMEKNMDEFKNLEDQDFAVLAANLQSNVDSLITNCTMTGQGHNELHKWLVPHIQLLEELSYTSNTPNAEEILRSIQVSFDTFNTYFE
jgi:hypothetical protein